MAGHPRDLRRRRVRRERRADPSIRLPSALEGPKGLEAVAFDLAGDEFLLLTFPADRTHFGNLTSAEQEIASELLRGKSYRQVARLRGSKYGTVANQIRSIFRKLQVHSRSELARAATAKSRLESPAPSTRKRT
jgi:DNA-binding NarL/FixJ family response regulator